MNVEVIRCELEEIKDLRRLFLHEHNFQFVHDKCHYYGWADCYLFLIDGTKGGYGSVWGTDKREDRDTIFEFYLIGQYKKYANSIFKELHAISKASYVECQTNEPLLASLLFENAVNISAWAMLFEDHVQTELAVPGVVFRKTDKKNDHPYDSGEYVLELESEIVATGGFLSNYNFPYSDIYMDVKEPFRGKGYCSFIVQELKKQIYSQGRVPAARCGVKNQASKACLQKAGFRPCGFILKGDIVKTEL